jgi:hypothetical protein
MALDPPAELFPDIFAQDASNALDGDGVVFRYMRLSAFLMLLEGNVFVPTILNLQKGDPFESKLPLRSFWYCDQFIGSLGQSDRSWLEEELPEFKRSLVRSGAEKSPQYLTEAWVA